MLRLNNLKKWEFILLAVIVIEFIIFGIANPKFLLPRVLLSSVNDIISICIISLFVTLVMVTGGIDIQAGAIVGLSSIALGVMWQDFGFNIWLACFIAFIICCICGAMSGFLVAYCEVQPMVVTLGGSFLFSGLALSISNLSTTASYKGISGFPATFVAISKFKLFGIIPSQLILFAFLTAVAYWLLERSKYGRKIFLIGVNKSAADYAGIKSNLLIMSTYVLSAASAAIAGIFLTSYLGTAKSDIGATFTLPIITSVVLGGTLSTGGKGSVLGTALASVVIGLMRFGLPLCFKVSVQYLDIPIGMLLFIVIVSRSLVKRDTKFFKQLLGLKA